jgi:HAD superfamily hydrolase (TIGR01509 family)
MNNEFPHAIIFDMDGLLVASEHVWQEAEAMLLEVRGKKLDLKIREDLIGLRMDEFLSRFKTMFGLDESIEILQEEVHRNMLALIPHEVKPQPGALEMLDYVQANRIPCAIASSSPTVIIEATIKSQGWEDLLQIRCSADSVAKGKPAPDVYLKAASLINTEPAHCLALEDSPNGAKAAVAAGMTCYAVPDGSHTRPEAFAGVTDYVFKSLHEVLAHLKSAKLA